MITTSRTGMHKQPMGARHRLVALKLNMLVLAVTVWAAVCSGATVAEQSYPHDTVKLVTHSRSGGGTDIFLRNMTKYLSKYLGADMVVENVTGGSGAKAMARLATAPPDGALFYGTTPTYINTSLLSAPRFTFADLEGVVNVFLDPQVVYVRKDSPFESLSSVVAAAKTDTSPVILGVGSPGSLDRQAMEELKVIADINPPIVTHDGGGELLVSVLNGTVSLGIGEVQELRAQIEADEVRLITTLTEDRLEQFPDVMTAKEQGIDLVVNKFRGIAGPRDLPADILLAWERAIASVLEDDAFKAWYEAQSLVPMFLPAAEYNVFLDEFAQEQRAFFLEYGVISD